MRTTGKTSKFLLYRLLSLFSKLSLFIRFSAFEQLIKLLRDLQFVLLL